MRARRSRFLRSVALIGMLMLLLAACGDDTSTDTTESGDDAAATTEAPDTTDAPDTTAASDTTAADGDVEETPDEMEVGPAEDTEITVAIPFPDITMYSMYITASDLGFYEEEGLTVEVITADDVLAAVSSGSADVGVESAGSVIEGIRNDVGVTVLSGHFCRSSYDFAVQPEIETIEDLDGTNVVLAGTSGDPAQFERQRVLAEEGWDLDEIDVEVVYPGPDSAAWREFFIAERVSLIPFFGDDRPALEEYGAKIIVETIRNWPNDLQVMALDYLEENPNTAVRFLRATMKAVQHIQAPGVGEIPENKTEVLDIFEANDFDVENLRVQDTPFVLDGHFMCENLYYDEEAWETTIEVQSLEPLSYSENVDPTPMLTAQGLLGLENTGPVDIDYNP